MDKYNLEGKRVLVTGGSGVIGRELLRKLLQLGSQIMSVDRKPLPDGDWGSLRDVRLDLADDCLDELVAFKPQVIFHLAAGFERSKETPGFWDINWHDNVVVNNRVLDVVRKTDSVEVYVFASSYLVYQPDLYFFSEPPVQATLLKEDDLKSPRNLCGYAKYYAEGEMAFIAEYIHPEIRMVFPRIYRVYGRGSNDVVSRWVRSVMRGEDIELYNKDNQFDYIYAGDVAEGLVRLAQSPTARGPVNLGSGSARRVGELLDLVLGAVPDSTSKVADNGVVENYEASCADISRLKSMTGWAPQVSLEQGVALIHAWEQSRIATA